MFFRREKPRQLTFEDRLSRLKEFGFTVTREGNKARVSKLGCAAVLSDSGTDLPQIGKAGVVVGNEIGYLVHGGYQAFFETGTRRKVPALAMDVTVDKVRAYAPEADVVPFETRGQLFDALLKGEIYAAVASAERGSAWTLLHPEFSVSVPQPLVLTIPLAYPVAHRDEALRSFLDSWIEVQQRGGSFEEARDYWVLGKNAEVREPRWSVLRDVLHWVH